MDNLDDDYLLLKIDRRGIFPVLISFIVWLFVLFLAPFFLLHDMLLMNLFGYIMIYISLKFIIAHLTFKNLEINRDRIIIRRYILIDIVVDKKDIKFTRTISEHTYPYLLFVITKRNRMYILPGLGFDQRLDVNMALIEFIYF